MNLILISLFLIIINLNNYLTAVLALVIYIDLKLLYFVSFFCLDTIEIDKEYKTKIFVSKEIWMNFKSSYSNPIVLKKSLWYIVGMGAHILVNKVFKFIVLVYIDDKIVYNIETYIRRTCVLSIFFCLSFMGKYYLLS